MNMEYISYLDIADKVSGINKGGVVYLVSDILEFTKTAKQHGERFDRNLFINSIQDVLGANGTLLIPTFNWGFCNGETFDYYKTPSKTGALGNAALRRPDFKRTQHPIYSFAVWGKDTEFLVNKNNKNSFGKDTVFDYMYDVDATALIIGLPGLSGLTFIHHIEQMVGVPYRYEKNFESLYVGSDKKETMSCYSMYVRDLELNPQKINSFGPINGILEHLGISQCQWFNGVSFRTVRLKEMFPIVRADIINNDSGNLYTYTGQR